MSPSPNKFWMRAVLLAAALYNGLWGTATVLWPNLAFDLTGMTRPNYPELWQCIGMFVAVWGVGYACAAIDPVRHWPIVLVGFLGKIFGPIGFAWAVWQGRMPLNLGATIVTNDLIWWVPFGLILYAAHEHELGQRRTTSPEVQRMALRSRTQMGHTLDALSKETPVMMVFLRHMGCTFCRETLADLASHRQEIERNGTRIVLIHMGSEAQAVPMLRRYGLSDIDRVSDPRQSIYKAFGLNRGKLWALFGPKVWWRGFQAGILARHGVGTLAGDGFQMPGVFVVFHGEVIRSYIHQDASDRPNYLELVQDQAVPQSGTAA